jgi:hypothetical protein
MSCLCAQPYPHTDWIFLCYFKTVVSSTVQNLFQVDRSSGQDWRSVLRETCRYLEVVGGVFNPTQVGALQAIRHDIELSSDAEVALVVLHLLRWSIVLGPTQVAATMPPTVLYVGLTRSLLYSFHRTLDPTGTDDH